MIDLSIEFLGVAVIFITLAIVLALALLAVLLILSRRRGHAGRPAGSIEGASAEVARLRDRLSRTRRALTGNLPGFAPGRGLNEDFWAMLEDGLVAADVGVVTSGSVVAVVRAQSPGDAAAARTALEAELVRSLAGRVRTLSLDRSPSVILVAGVNGGGKTTSIAKLGLRLRREGSSVLFGAADTFRAAADQQLQSWADRVGVDIVAGQQGADPASVAFDAFQAASARGADVVIVDTAGRLQSQSNLMDELAKVARVLRREAGDLDEVLLVIDGNTGQNAIAQAQRFAEAVAVTGIVLTKLDGTARGGVAVAIEREMDIPVKFIGIGEGMEDLIPFKPAEFVAALLGP